MSSISIQVYATSKTNVQFYSLTLVPTSGPSITSLSRYSELYVLLSESSLFILLSLLNVLLSHSSALLSFYILSYLLYIRLCAMPNVRCSLNYVYSCIIQFPRRTFRKTISAKKGFPPKLYFPYTRRLKKRRQQISKLAYLHFGLSSKGTRGVHEESEDEV